VFLESMRNVITILYNSNVSKKKDARTPQQLMPLPWDKKAAAPKKRSRIDVAAQFENMEQLLKQKQNGSQ